MKRKIYESPTMKIVKLQQQTQLLAGSINAILDGTFTEENLSREMIFEQNSLEPFGY